MAFQLDTGIALYILCLQSWKIGSRVKGKTRDHIKNADRCPGFMLIDVEYEMGHWVGLSPWEFLDLVLVSEHCVTDGTWKCSGFQKTTNTFLIFRWFLLFERHQYYTLFQSTNTCVYTVNIQCIWTLDRCPESTNFSGWPVRLYQLLSVERHEMNSLYLRDSTGSPSSKEFKLLYTSSNYINDKYPRYLTTSLQLYTPGKPGPPSCSDTTLLMSLVAWHIFYL